MGCSKPLSLHPKPQTALVRGSWEMKKDNWRNSRATPGLGLEGLGILLNKTLASGSRPCL